MDILWRILATLALVALNGFFVAAEFAAVSSRQSRLERLARSSFLGRASLQIKKRLDLYLSACQLGVTLASLGLGAVLQPAVTPLIEPLLSGLSADLKHEIALALALAISTTLHIVIGEQAPKYWSIQFADRILLAIAPPLMLFTFIFYPLIALLNRCTRALLSVVGVKVRPELHGELPHTEDELRALLVHAVSVGSIDKGEGKLLKSAFEFAERRTRQIMTPRTNVDYLLLGQPVREILQTVQKTQFTRLPICDGDLDHVIGLVHMKDLFNHLKLVPGRLRFTDATTPAGEAIAIADGLPGSELHVIGSADIDLKQIRRDVLFVPESLPLPKLLHQFQTQHVHMACVVDEYGATQGIVTLEDVLEELVGEIGDEFDPISPGDFVADRDGYRTSGLFALHELKEKLAITGVDTPDVDTIGGYVVQQLGRWPRVGDVVELGSFQIRVVTIQQKRVGQVTIRPSPAAKAPPAGAKGQ